jgi:hypothetical protein
MNTTTRKLRLALATATLTAAAFGIGIGPADAQPAASRGVSIDYQKLDAMRIDRTGVDAAVAALVR